MDLKLFSVNNCRKRMERKSLAGAIRTGTFVRCATMMGVVALFCIFDNFHRTIQARLVCKEHLK